MKKTQLLFLLVFPITLFSQWQQVGPPDIEASKILFNIDGNESQLICAKDGIYSNAGGEWDFYSVNGLTARDACKLDDENTLVIFGGYIEFPFPEEDYNITTDGIYVFNNISKEINLVEWCNNPNFINYHFYTNRYFIGYSSGLYVSTNGYDWSHYKPYYFQYWLSNNSMDNYDIHFCLTNSNVHHSNNQGDNWVVDESFYHSISLSTFLYATLPREGSVKFHPNGTAYLITQRYLFNNVGPSYLQSYKNAALARSYDYCNSWNLISFSPYLKTIGFDMMDNVFLGWDAMDTCQTKGLAYFDRLTQETTIINQGLPDLHIHHITHDPEGSYTNLYVCTDKGVFFNPNPILSSASIGIPNIDIEFFPNPCMSEINFRIPKELHQDIETIKVFDLMGNEIKNILFDKGQIQESLIMLKTINFRNGLYFLEIKSNRHIITNKFIVKN